MALKRHFEFTLSKTKYARNNLKNEELFKVLRNEFDKKFSYSIALLLPFLFSVIANEKKSFDYFNPINKFKIYFTAKILVRIDKKMDTETIQILSVSDEDAKLTKPEWWQKNGTCHVISSYMGKVEIVAKAIVEGNVQIRLAGPYVRNPDDNSKCIPYWIDYTKLIVNDKIIFDTLTPAWHNKPYKYTMEAKADEEIKIQVEWQPHRSDT